MEILFKRKTGKSKPKLEPKSSHRSMNRLLSVTSALFGWSIVTIFAWHWTPDELAL